MEAVLTKKPWGQYKNEYGFVDMVFYCGKWRWIITMLNIMYIVYYPISETIHEILNLNERNIQLKSYIIRKVYPTRNRTKMFPW